MGNIGYHVSHGSKNIDTPFVSTTMELGIAATYKYFYKKELSSKRGTVLAIDTKAMLELMEARLKIIEDANQVFFENEGEFLKACYEAQKAKIQELTEKMQGEGFSSEKEKFPIILKIEESRIHEMNVFS